MADNGDDTRWVKPPKEEPLRAKFQAGPGCTWVLIVWLALTAFSCTALLAAKAWEAWF